MLKRNLFAIGTLVIASSSSFGMQDETPSNVGHSASLPLTQSILSESNPLESVGLFQGWL